jgi:hypothetical protein
MYPMPQGSKRTWYQRLFAWCRRHPIATAIIIVVILVVGIISNVTAPQTTTTSPTPTAQATQAVQEQPTVDTSQPTATPQPKSIAQQVNDLVGNAGMLGQVSTTYGYTDNPKAVVVKDNIGDGNLTNALTVGEIHLECFNAQKALWTAHLDLTEVLVQISMNVVDQYGNASNQLVATCDLVSATAQKFNWDNLDQDSAWQVYDNTSIAPFLTK